MDLLKKSRKIKKILPVKEASVFSRVEHTHSYKWHCSKLSLMFILAFLTAVAIQGCDSKKSPLSAYEQKCQSDLYAVGQAINNIKKKAVSQDGLTVNTAAKNPRLMNESQLWGINSALISIDNTLNASRLDGALFTDNELKKAAVQCELSNLEKKQNLLSDTQIYSSINNLDLSESLVTTQHFYNKLLALFRHYGAAKGDEDRQQILQLQQTLARLEIDRRQGSYGASITSYLSLSEQENQVEEQLSRILGYPRQSMRVLDQTMALDEEAVFEFIKNIESQLLSLRPEIDPEISEKKKLNYSQFREGLFEAVAILFKIEFLPAKKTINQEGDEDKGISVGGSSTIFEAGMIEKYDVLKNGQIIGHLELHVFDSIRDNIKNQFYPVKKGIKGPQTENNQLPEAAINLALDGDNKTNTKERLMSISAANEFVFLIGEYLAHLSSANQEWILNSGIAVESDFENVPGYVLQQWLYRPKLLKVILANNKSVAAEEYLSQIKQEDFLAIKEQLITAKLRIAYLNVSSDLSLMEKEEKIKSLLQSTSAKYSLNLSKDKTDKMIKAMLACHSFCYEPLWSKMIAMDIMTAIDQWNELDEVMVNRFMEKILVSGASRTAEDGVSDFLGRYYNEKAFSIYFSE